MAAEPGDAMDGEGDERGFRLQSARETWAEELLDVDQVAEVLDAMDDLDPVEDTGELDLLGDMIGYRKAVDTPVSLLLNTQFTADYELAGRADVLAGEGYTEPPLVNQLQASVGPEMLELLEAALEEDEHVVRFYPGTDVPTRTKDYLRESTFYTVVNPMNSEHVFADKGSFFDVMRDTELPTLPSKDVAAPLAFGGSVLEGNAFDGFDRYVLLPDAGANGEWVREAEGLDGVESYVGEYFGEEVLEEYEDWEKAYYTPIGIRMEPFIEHEADLRVFATDEVVSAEARYGEPEDFRCNLSQVEGEYPERLVRVYEEGLGEPLDVSRSAGDWEAARETEGTAPLPESVEAVVEDAVDWLDDYLEADGMFVAADVMVADREAVEALPPRYRDPILAYADDEHAYILSEVNGMGGDMIGQLLYWEGLEDQLPVVHEYRELCGLAGEDPVDTGSRLWNRVDEAYYDAPAEVEQDG